MSEIIGDNAKLYNKVANFGAKRYFMTINNNFEINPHVEQSEINNLALKDIKYLSNAKDIQPENIFITNPIKNSIENMISISFKVPFDFRMSYIMTNKNAVVRIKKNLSKKFSVIFDNDWMKLQGNNHVNVCFKVNQYLGTIEIYQNLFNAALREEISSTEFNFVYFSNQLINCIECTEVHFQFMKKFNHNLIMRNVNYFAYPNFSKGTIEVFFLKDMSFNILDFNEPRTAYLKCNDSIILKIIAFIEAYTNFQPNCMFDSTLMTITAPNLEVLFIELLIFQLNNI